ncbi:Arylesterase [uncultured Alphaproteobacteria bacterium]|jgi:acyl-CoA thioesterase-1|uniref:Arylesterase n=1 Tax=uncultured Alphaproteobacteria bacterium TaxID=91750 RepID=A0A212K8W0_9PROT|nr:Arylesterase [uncultured Alphaproteobacteria bacterium]
MSILTKRLRGVAVAAALVGAAAPAAGAAEPLAVLAFGDSLTAGYGLPENQAFPQVLERRLRDMGWNVRVRNGGVSGDTTAGGRARLEWMLEPRPDAVILELGANDALRGLPPAQAKDNLAAILAELKRRGIPVLLAPMAAPRNLGPDYVQAFDAIYPALAKDFGVPLAPLFILPIVDRPDLTLGDAIHPNAAGVEKIVAAILPDAVKLLEAARAAKGAE